MNHLQLFSQVTFRGIHLAFHSPIVYNGMNVVPGDCNSWWRTFECQKYCELSGQLLGLQVDILAGALRSAEIVFISLYAVSALGGITASYFLTLVNKQSRIYFREHVASCYADTSPDVFYHEWVLWEELPQNTGVPLLKHSAKGTQVYMSGWLEFFLIEYICKTV